MHSYDCQWSLLVSPVQSISLLRHSGAKCEWEKLCFRRSAQASLATASRVASKHTLPDLPYDYSALEPVISRDIMSLHHSKHHAAYVTNLNAAEEKLHAAISKGMSLCWQFYLWEQTNDTHVYHLIISQSVFVFQAQIVLITSTVLHSTNWFFSGDVSTAISLGPALKFNGGGHINHTIFWQNLSPAITKPDGKKMQGFLHYYFEHSSIITWCKMYLDR